MATNFTQQEILLMTGTSFSARQFAEKDDQSNSKNFSKKEQLEDACWNGLLPEMLPEVFNKETDAHKIYLWQIKEANAFIELELSEFPEKIENYFSIDPYVFMNEKIFN